MRNEAKKKKFLRKKTRQKRIRVRKRREIKDASERDDGWRKTWVRGTGEVVRCIMSLL